MLPNHATMPKLILTILVFLSLAACTPGTEKLDEAVIYNGSKFKLKLVRYYEKTGEIFNVQCSSSRTVQFPALKTQDAGWVTLDGGSAVGFKNAGQLIERQRWKYLIVDERTLVWVGDAFNISFDACGHFRTWYPMSFPPEMIIPAEKPASCKSSENPDPDCWTYDFQGERAPSFTQIQVEPAQGLISFVVQSRAFRNTNGFRIRSTDYGKTWQIESL